MARRRTVVRDLSLPGNPRYQPKDLQYIFGYDNLFVPFGEVEIATLEVLGEIGVIPKEDIELLTTGVVKQILAIRTTEVDEIERTITKHDARAWVRKAQEILPAPLRRWVHVPLTTYDPFDTARVLQFRRAHEDVLKPKIREVIKIFVDLIKKFSDQVQIGRTHGQHALPITVGFWLATTLNRIIYNAKIMESCALQMVGKISGAVGCHNAQIGLGITKRCGSKTFEKRILEKLGLGAARISTQILPPEPMAYFLYSCIMLSAVLGQFGDDARHLMRSEIAELAEAFEEGQVGSSTMAHKRNPINFENLKGMWLKNKNEFGKVLDTLISDHQRDLVGSSVARDFPIIVVNLTNQLNTLLRKDKKGVTFLSKIWIDSESCRRNFDKNAHLILAEPIYIALQMAGYEGDAHELVNRHAVPIAQNKKIPLIEVIERMAKEDGAVAKALAAMPSDLIHLLHTPEQYVGDAKEKAHEVVAVAGAYLLN